MWQLTLYYTVTHNCNKLPISQNAEGQSRNKHIFQSDVKKKIGIGAPSPGIGISIGTKKFDRCIARNKGGTILEILICIYDVGDNDVNFCVALKRKRFFTILF